MLPTKFSSEKKEELKEFAQEAAQQLKKEYQNTNSSNIGYWYYYVSVYYYFLNQRYKQALKQAHKLLQLIKSESAVSSKARRGSCHLQIAKILTYLGKYAEATKHALNAKQYYKKGLLDELQALEILFHLYFYREKLTDARNILERAFNHPKVKEDQSMNSRFYYYKATLLFSEGNYKDSLAILNRKTALAEDRKGWLLGYKLLEILNYIELDETGPLESKVDTFRKLLYKQKKSHRHKTRAYVIYRILLTLIKNQRNKACIYELEKENFNKLSEPNGSYMWEPFKHETIRFDTWFYNRFCQKSA